VPEKHRQQCLEAFLDYYGSATPLSQVSKLAFLMREQLRYSLWKNMLQVIEKAIMVIIWFNHE
jgi:ribosome recycling factor